MPVHILWFNDYPAEIEPYADALRDQDYLVDIVSTVTEAVHRLEVDKYNLLILDVMIPTWTDQEDDEYPPDITNRGRTLGLQFYLKNKDKLRNKGTQVLVITKLEEIRDGFIQAGLPKEQFCTAFSLRRVREFLRKVG